LTKRTATDALLLEYRRVLIEFHLKMRFLDQAVLNKRIQQAEHGLGMIDRMLDMDPAEKLNRWLGFLQGLLFCLGLRTVEQLEGDVHEEFCVPRHARIYATVSHASGIVDKCICGGDILMVCSPPVRPWKDSPGIPGRRSVQCSGHGSNPQPDCPACQQCKGTGVVGAKQGHGYERGMPGHPDNDKAN
jgi:hypothetical protein